MIKTIYKPLTIETDSDSKVTIQVCKTSVIDSMGERETPSEICLCVESVNLRTLPIFFTVNQALKLSEKLKVIALAVKRLNAEEAQSLNNS